MPGNQTATHPNGRVITFNEPNHTYIDDRGNHYTSVTGLIKKFVEPFDEDGTAARIAKRDGKSKEEILAAWKQKRDEACLLGTRVHENNERQLLGQGDLHQPRHDHERDMMCAAWTFCHGLLTAGWHVMATEQIVFHPGWYIAGTVDLIMRAPDAGLWFLDWKTNGKLSERGFNQLRGPVAHLDDSDLNKYRLQLNIYDRLAQAFIGGEVIRKGILYIQPSGVQAIPVDDLHLEATAMILEAVTDVPF